MLKSINYLFTMLVFLVVTVANSVASNNLNLATNTALGKYNATLNGNDSIAWETKASSPTPGRYWCPAVGVIRDTIYLLGGRGDGGYANSIRLIHAYVPALDTWVTNLPTLLRTRRAGAGGQVGNKIYVCGGRDSNYVTLNSCEEFDVDTKLVTTKANMPEARWSCSGTAIGNKVYIFGSESNSNTLLEYNTSTDSWRSISPTPRPRGRANTAVAAAGDKLYVLGGIISGDTILNDCWQFNPITETWTEKANMPEPRIWHSAIGVEDNNIYVIGGTSSGTSPVDGLVYKYTISTNTWTTEAPMPTARGWEMLAVNQDVIYAMCGSDCSTPTYLTVNEACILEASRVHDVGVRNIIHPVGRIPSGVSINVEAVIKNFGTNDETFPTTALITESSNTVFEKETTLTINAQQEQSIVFGNFTPTTDLVYDALFYTDLAGDENPANDTMTAEARTTPDAGVLRIVSPNGRIIPATITDAKAVVMNFSAEPKNVPATMKIVDTVTGNTILDKDTTLAISAVESLAVVFGQFTSTTGSFYEIITYTNLAGDDDPSNDTAYATAVCRYGSARDPFGYYYESTQEPVDTVTFSWIDPTGGIQLTDWVPNADDGIITRTLPFGIRFYTEGNPNITQINVCTNGFLETSTATTFANTALPNNTIQNLIAPFWDNFDLRTQGVVFEKSGTDQSYVAYTWVEVPRIGTSELQTFQIVLYSNNKIRFNYLDVNGTLNSNTIGIQGGNGANGWFQQYVFDGDPVNHIVTNNTTIAFTCDRIVGIEEEPLIQTSERIFLGVQPNPITRHNSEIVFGVAQPENLSLTIFDASGRVVKTLVQGQFNPGKYVVVWNATDNIGRNVGSGIYFLVYRSADNRLTKKLILIGKTILGI